MESIGEQSPGIEEQENDLVYLYRGIERTHSQERVGKWWSTNPYYALTKASGSLFFAKVPKAELEKYAKDVSLEAEYENYYFSDQDPSTARLVTEEELKELQSKARYSKGKIGGTMMKPPDNPIEVGRAIFKPQKMS